ncbi:hypothetical protein PGT21_014542 [Puccinia graminis f. sp. tritici]|uniref:4a-hydroxytetrahydrobiopterin dehydratase n=1 Tax=Puccinia graminis f. sp. tritici TaxID=56615 RepID=A0A5B0QTF1_PUCGR|nr:hypothetical protein PGT21_014542 [Puccinia graminis f. sp. tritici]
MMRSLMTTGLDQRDGKRVAEGSVRAVREIYSSSSSSSSSSSGRSGRPSAIPIGEACREESASNLKVPRLYTTRESVEEALRSDERYSALASSGWQIVPLPARLPSVVVLQKSFPPRQPFGSWDAILAWIDLHLRPIANELDHHPDVSITNFNQLTLTLFTHSVNALTPRDFRLALRIDQVVPKNSTADRFISERISRANGCGYL